MRPETQLRRGVQRGLRWFVPSLSIAIAWIALLSPLGRWSDNISYDILFAFYGPQHRDDAALVYMDYESARQLGQPDSGRYDRAVHAKLIDKLSGLGAKAIVFDALFEHPDTNNPASDQALIDAAQRQRFVFAGAVQRRGNYSLLPAAKVVPPFPELRRALAGYGLVEGNLEGEPIRDMTTDLAAVSSLANVVADAFSPIPVILQRERSPRLNYYGAPLQAIPGYRYFDVLTNRLELRGAFSNRVVFVGQNSVENLDSSPDRDLHPTPFTRWTGLRAPGVEINATAFLNLVHHEWLRRGHPLAEAIALVVTGLVTGLAPAPRRFKTGVLLLGLSICSIAWVAWILAWRWHIWAPWLIPIVFQVPVGVAALLLQRSREGQSDVVPLRREFKTEPWSIPDHELVRKIGTGGYGDVWLARNALGGFHAVKIVERSRFSGPDPYEREFNGVRNFMPISRGHPGWVPILHVGRNDLASGYFYYVMELADSKAEKLDVETYEPKTLSSADYGQSPASPLQIARIGLELAEALQYLHQHGLVHRDVKPSNVLFWRGSPRFADIGLVTQFARTGRDVSFVGTAGFVAPEGPGTPGGDVFGLGKLLQSLQTDRLVSDSQHLDETSARQQQRLSTILQKATAMDPDRRYASAAALAQSLNELLKDSLF